MFVYTLNDESFATTEGVVYPSQLLRRARYDPERYGLLIEYGTTALELILDDHPLFLDPSFGTLRCWPVVK